MKEALHLVLDQEPSGETPYPADKVLYVQDPMAPRTFANRAPPCGYDVRTPVRNGKFVHWVPGQVLLQAPGTQGGWQTHHTGTSPTHSHRCPQTRPLKANKALKGRPRGLRLGPANGWAALSKRFGGYPNSAPTGGAALPG